MNTELVQVATDDGQHLTMHPLTGEAVNLPMAAPVDLADMAEQISDAIANAYAFKRAIDDELAARVDRTGSRTAWIGPLNVEVNAPTTESYDLVTLRDGLQRLVAEGILDAAAVDRVIVTPPPKQESPRVDKRAVNTLKKMDEPVVNVIAAARVVVPQKRTVKILFPT